jgi:hypothetical protein
MTTFTDPASGRPYTLDPTTGQSVWLDQAPPAPPSIPPTAATPSGPSFNDVPRARPKTVAGIVGLIVGVIGLTLSWVPIVNNVAFFFALVSGILGVVGLIATRRTGKKSARWTAISAVVLTGLTIGIVLLTQALYTKAVDNVSKTLGSLSIATPGTNAKAGGTSLPSGVAKFGSAVTFKDGSTLTCSAPVAFKRTEFAAGGDGAKAFLKARCTFSNRSDKVFNPAGTTGSMSADGVEGESVYQDGLGSPSNPVFPGKSVTWWMGYGVGSSNSVQLTVSLGFLNYDSITFN